MKKLFSILLFLMVTGALAQEKSTEVSIPKKMETAQTLVDKAVDFFKKQTVAKACRAFQQDERWRAGEMFVFVFAADGTCYVHNEDFHIIWRDYFDEKDEFAESFIKEMVDKGEEGGWVSYPWNHSIKQSYVKTVTKNGKQFIIGTGFFPESAEFTVQQLTKSALRFLKTNGAQEAFDRINNPVGFFVRGDIYLWAYDITNPNEAVAVAHGENLAMVGQNLINWQDADGRFRNKEMVKIAQSPEGKGWLEYSDRGVPKRAYMEKVVDPKTKKVYVFGGGYYPTINDNAVRTFVKRAINYLKTNGKDAAFRDFSNNAGGFIKGPLRIFVYSLDGTLMADSQNPSFIGQNLINSKDAEGKFIAKRIIDQAKDAGNGWISFMDKRAYRDVYVEKIQVPDGDFIIGAGYWPSSKPRSVQSFVEKALGFIKTHSLEESLRAFTTDDSDFVRGDLAVFVYDTAGNCLANGLDKTRIWQNDMDLKDNKGQRIADKLVTTATTGGGWVEYRMHNATRRVYVKQAEKPAPAKSDQLDKQEPNAAEADVYIVGSGYYL